MKEIIYRYKATGEISRDGEQEMKAILMSIKPKWCEKIFNGEKTVEVRKVAPKLEPPFKVYMYRTKEKCGAKIINDCLNSVYGGGKVVGEWVCDKVIEYDYIVIACAKFEVNGAYVKEENRYNAGACLSAEEMYEYSKGKSLCGLHITKVKRYDTPKELSAFRTPETRFHEVKWVNGHINFGSGYKSGKVITRPPQSWMYVEEIVE